MTQPPWLNPRPMNCLAILLVAGCSTFAQTGATPNSGDPWSAVPEIQKRIVPPRFPARDFDITRFGAVADGTTVCTTAFSNAIAACARAGGGRVVVPAGKFLTGAIHLRSGVNLHLADGAEIIFSDQLGGLSAGGARARRRHRALQLFAADLRARLRRTSPSPARAS